MCINLLTDHKVGRPHIIHKASIPKGQYFGLNERFVIGCILQGFINLFLFGLLYFQLPAIYSCRLNSVLKLPPRLYLPGYPFRGMAESRDELLGKGGL